MFAIGNKFGLKKCTVGLAGSPEVVSVSWVEFKRRLWLYVRDTYEAKLQQDRSGRLVLSGKWPAIVFRDGELEKKGSKYVAKDLTDNTFSQLLKWFIPKFIERIDAMRTDIKQRKLEDSISEIDPRKASFTAYLSYF